MSAALLSQGFTSSDWFQLTYPLILFIVGEILGRLHALRQRAEGSPTISVHLSQVVHAAIPDPSQPRAARRPPRRRRSSSDQDAGGLIVLGVVVAFGMGCAYVYGREVALTLAVAPIGLTLGLIAGRIHGLIKARVFAWDWWLGLIVWLVLAAAALGCELALLHPPAAPAAYDAVFDGLRREGVSVSDLFDHTFMFITYQAIGVFALILAAVMLVGSIAAVLSKDGLIRGAPATRWRRVLAAGATGRGAVARGLAAVSLLLAVSFAFGSGYAYRWVTTDSKSTGAARVLAPSATLTGRRALFDFVTDRRSRVRITVQRRPRSKPLGSWQLTLPAGRHRVVRWLSSGRHRVVVTMTPMDAGARAGTVRRLWSNAATTA